MITKAEQDELKRDREYEEVEDATEERRLHTDYYYAREKLIECCLSEVRDDLQHLIVKMESYGWSITIDELTDELRDI